MTLKTPKKPIDFTKVEALRKEMMLTIENMASLFGVTRATYHFWLKGKPLRPSNDEYVRVMLKKLLTAYTEHSWPSPEVRAMDSKQRKERLDMLLQLDK